MVTPEEKPYKQPHQTIPDHAVFITPPPSIHGGGQSQAKRPISRPPPQHAGINIPGLSYPQNSGSIQDIISHHISQPSSEENNNGRVQNKNRRHEKNKYNQNYLNLNNGKTQSFRPPIQDLTKPPPIIIGQTTERSPQHENKKYKNRLRKNYNHPVISPVTPTPYHHQNLGQNSYPLPPSHDGIDRYDTNVRDDAVHRKPYPSHPTNEQPLNLFDTHNRLLPIIIDDSSAQDNRDRTQHAKNYNRRIDTSQHYYDDRSAAMQPVNAIDPNDYKFYSFVTDSPKQVVTRRTVLTTTERPIAYTPTRAPPSYTTRRTYTYKPYQAYAPSPKLTTSSPNLYNLGYNPIR